MMMQALQAGGMKIYYNEEKEKKLYLQSTPEYQANPHGFYELANYEITAKDFPEKYRGMAIKLLHDGLRKLPVGKYKIIYMMRNPSEIEASIKRVWGKNMTLSPDTYQEFMKEGIEYMSNRRDMQYVILHYKEVINAPYETFTLLKDLGWKINPNNASSVVDPDMYRNRAKEGPIHELLQKILGKH